MQRGCTVYISKTRVLQRNYLQEFLISFLSIHPLANSPALFVQYSTIGRQWHVSVYFRWRFYVSTMFCLATDTQSTDGLFYIQFSEEFYNFGYTKM